MWRPVSRMWRPSRCSLPPSPQPPPAYLKPEAEPPLAAAAESLGKAVRFMSPVKPKSPSFASRRSGNKAAETSLKHDANAFSDIFSDI